MKINLSGEWFGRQLIKLSTYLSKRFPMSEESAEKYRCGLVRYGKFLYRRTKSKNKWVRRYHINVVNSVKNGPESVEEMHKEYLKLNLKK